MHEIKMQERIIVFKKHVVARKDHPSNFFGLYSRNLREIKKGEKYFCIKELRIWEDGSRTYHYLRK